MNPEYPYTLSHFSYQRIPSRVVHIGDVPMGGNHPIRIQSMTTTDTMDTMATVEQVIRMVDAGCEYARITAPSRKDANNLQAIRDELRRRGVKIPIVADIHFTPNAAEIAARIVEKVRVNPGNYADKKRFKEIEYTDESYQDEIERIHKRFSPLVQICKEEGTVMRIGTNHGSLSDRILSRYGDTALGMVESAMEFIRICEEYHYHNLVISMKASNPQVMVQAYRLLMKSMLEAGNVYPLHLGVTEAGEGEDGRIKSALGISTLLLDGIGDTVRVSLTEEPEYEMPVAQFLVDYHVKQANKLREAAKETPQQEQIKLPFSPFGFSRRPSHTRVNIGSEHVPRVISDLSGKQLDPPDLSPVGYTYVESLDKYNFSDLATDYVYLGDQVPVFELPGGLKKIYDANIWRLLSDNSQHFPLFDSPEDFLKAPEKSASLNFIRLTPETLPQAQAITSADMVVWVLRSEEGLPVYSFRKMIYKLETWERKDPIIIQIVHTKDTSYYEDDHLAEHLRLGQDARTQLSLSSQLSTLLVDGLVDGVWLEKADEVRLRTAFGALQMSRLRITKTEYISCPSCGRTLFDLQETTAKIRERTEHLKGVKIGIMGCIVNGPGEMADADYGYVGVGPGKIALYRGKTVVEKAVQTVEAVDKLIDLIRADGKWIEPESVELV
ncbi:MAG: (E)-4-hydroxy-3-methylbut-2-enyl-diphosphate synthase [Bacteroidota bacterium]